MQFLISSFFMACLLKMSYGADWCYQSQVTCETHCKGPALWPEANGGCGGRSQSPINIVTKRALPDERLTPFRFTGYEHAFKATLNNNGHSVKVDIKHEATVRGGDLDGVYKAVQFHLHWGKDGGPGSEHTVDGEQYPMELHIVHMKDKYSSLTDALKDPTGVAVLGFFYEPSTAVNKNYDTFISALGNVINHSDTKDITHPISLHQLILTERNMTNYYRYQGSLTTPGCTEAVVWTVFQHAIPLHQTQLRTFSSLKFVDGKSMVDTFRPVQPLNGRQVYRSGSATVLSCAALLVTSVAMAFSLSHPN
ncbi:carbonic anhydrase 4a [Clupea harengus]|uniref:Carbonic anhydrase n=1 Tax=Clupea harengus TaxID=7950 RepID=A0A6P3VQ00_CLUHA|nr:carbonic anhydrase 4a [Clupea harengus]